MGKYPGEVRIMLNADKAQHMEILLGGGRKLQVESRKAGCVGESADLEI